jgi:hypothetical protein
MNNNIYKYFRQIQESDGTVTRTNLSKRFDEPTYLSFKLQFAQNNDDIFNVATNKALYDTMPHPLFDNRISEDDLGKTTVNVPAMSNFINSAQIPISISAPGSYSAVQYLINANEPTRAALLIEFIDKFNQLQNNFQYYFQSIEGVAELLKIDPLKGQRITSDKKLIITCLEGLDLRISYLMNLYRKIVWDDIYQRWVLPDMMRYFTLQIYLSEFRTFHIPQTTGKKMDGYGNIAGPSTETINKSIVSSAYKTITTFGAFDSGVGVINSRTPGGLSLAGAPNANPTASTPLYLSILDDVLPVWLISCEMCEFDITDINFDHLTSLSVNNEPIQGAVKFGIKVGNIKEIQTYPVFKHMFLSDKRLNGINRSKEDEISKTYSSSDPKSTASYSTYPTILKVAQNRVQANESNDTANHETGRPYIERANKNTTTDANYAFSDKIPDKPEEQITSSWINNAMETGIGFAKAFANRYVDKAKITSIPGLGFSFTDVTTALEAKDLVGALGLVRKSITVVANEHVMPSEKLDDEIIDGTFAQFLVGVSKSSATDSTSILLKEAANVALSDRGVWEKIRDYSLATDYVTKGEVNVKKDVQGGELTGGKSIGKLIPAGLPKVDPNAVSGNLNQDPNLNQGKASSNLSGQVGEPIDRGITASTLIKGVIQSELNRDVKSSVNLSGEVGGGIDQGVKPSSYLAGDVNDGLDRGIAPSSNLSGDVGGALNRGVKSSSNLSGDVAKGGLNNDAIPSQNLTGNVGESQINRGTASTELGQNITTGGLNKDVAPSANLKDDINGGMTQAKSSGLLSEMSESGTLKNVKPSSKLSDLEATGTLNEAKPRKIIEQTALLQVPPSVKTKTIDVGKVIESTPSSLLIKQIQTEDLKQAEISRATNNKLQDGKPATTDEKSQATNQELFSP